LSGKTKEEISYLESTQTSLDIAMTEDDLAAIKEELSETGYVRRKTVRKKIKLKNEPLHYISSDGFHMYVGKNNLQNDALTFDFAAGCDWWFHAKQAPGSHVIVKTNGEDPPKKTTERTAEPRRQQFHTEAAADLRCIAGSADCPRLRTGLPLDRGLKVARPAHDPPDRQAEPL